MKAFKMTVAAVALTVSGAAMAGPGWTYVEAGYNIGDNDLGNLGPWDEFPDGSYKDNTKGYNLGGSLGFANIWHAKLNYWKGDYYIKELERKGYNVVLGIHPAVTDSTDLVFEINYTKLDYRFDFGGEKFKDSGGGLETGLRSMLSDTVEGNATISLQKTDFKNYEVAANLGGAWNFATNWAITARATIGESETNFNAGIRWYLGQYNKL